MNDLKSAAETQNVRPMKSGGKNKLFLMISGGVLLVALVVCAVLLLQTPPAEDDADRVIEFGTVMKGVSVGGIDISGMTKEEALAATAELSAQLLSQVNFIIDVNSEQLKFTAQDFELYTDYDAVMEKAVAYGRTGSFDERLAAANEAKESGIDFPVDVLVDEAKLKTALAALKSQMDTAPIDATMEFAPWGYTAAQNGDGTVTYTKYTPDIETLKAICTAYSKNKEYDGFPELVRLGEEDKPNALRYEYWNDDHYQENYIPRDWNIARFIYTEEVTGLIVDTDAVANAVISQVQSDTYGIIVAPVEVTPAVVTLEDVKNKTQLIASWTSSYREHSSTARNYNVAMMSSLLSGAEIEPEEIWSVNDTAGSRNATTARTYGWKEASGIENGGYTPQYGGGVCQLGSTVFNAAIRAGVSYTEHIHHSIPSDYIPVGLDSTLDSPRGTKYAGKDLKLLNKAQYTVYLVSYINPAEKNVTVEFYGVPLTNDAGQQILLRFSSRQTGRFGAPSSSVKEVIGPFECPDGTIIQSGGLESYQFAKERQGTYARVDVTTIGLDGVQIGDTVEFDKVTYPVINGIRYVLKVEEPPPPSESPSAEPSAG